MMKYLRYYAAVAGLFIALSSIAQTPLDYNRGHSHNDYHQHIPLLTAYYAGMGSVEADVFLRNGELFVAHEPDEISAEATLKKLYLDPLASFYRKNGNQAYKDSSHLLQLVIDIKQDYKNVIAKLIKELSPYGDIFNSERNAKAIRIVLSGDMPAPVEFKNYPNYISFDGRPNTGYTDEQLKRIAMISDDLKSYTTWNGKGTPTKIDEAKLHAVIEKAHQQRKPFRFWASQDSPNTWIVLEKLGVDWINTDHPEQLREFYLHKDKLNYTNPVAYPVYTPSYISDGLKKPAKNVILLIGDGMGLAQIHAATIANHGHLNIGKIRNIGFSQTGAANSGNTDSAAGGSALAIGEKTNNRYIGMTPDNGKRTNLVDTLAGYGIKGGIISVGDITDATPAVFYAHQADRSMSQEIAQDLLSSRAEIVIGSNQKSFFQNRDEQLIKKLAGKGFKVSTTLAGFSTETDGKQLVLLADSATRPVKDGRKDILKQALSHTIELLSANKKGFFIMAEGAQIDYGGHANDLPYVVTELHDFDKAVAEALRFADQDGETLVIITADHETGGLTLLDADVEKGSISGAFSTNDHTNIMVPVFAYGPGADEFRGTYQNNEIFHKILKVLALSKKN